MSPLNRRATSYILNKSDRAKRGETIGNEDWFAVYGNVVVTGPVDVEGYAADVPETLLERFGISVDRGIGAQL